jgi:WD40 repeat protein
LGEDNVLITASNKAVKLWPMKESKAEPQVFSKSDRIAFDRLQISGKMLIGQSDKAKTIAIWDLETK